MKKLLGLLAIVIAITIGYSSSVAYAENAQPNDTEYQMVSDILNDWASFPLVQEYLDVAVKNRNHLYAMSSLVKTALDRTNKDSVIQFTDKERELFDYHLTQLVR